VAVATEDWSRPAFEPGGGDATLFFLAFGELGLVRLPPVPPGLALTVHPQGEARLWVEPLVAGSGEAENGQPTLAALVRKAADFAVLRGQRADPPDLRHLRDAEAMLAGLLEAGAIALLDVEAQRWWTPQGFRGEVLSGVRPALRAHLSVLARSGVAETRGLRKFGRPDLRLRGVPPEAQSEAVGLCWSLAERLVRGARLGPGFTASGVQLQPGGDAGHPSLEGEWPRAAVTCANSA
jgi:hypothetical protein